MLLNENRWLSQGFLLYCFLLSLTFTWQNEGIIYFTVFSWLQHNSSFSFASFIQESTHMGKKYAINMQKNNNLNFTDPTRMSQVQIPGTAKLDFLYHTISETIGKLMLTK